MFLAKPIACIRSENPEQVLCGLYQLLPTHFTKLDPIFIEGITQMLMSGMIAVKLLRWVGNLPRDRAIYWSRVLHHHSVLHNELGIAMFEADFLTWKSIICCSLMPMWFVMSHIVGLGPWNMSANGSEGGHKTVAKRVSKQPVQVTSKYGRSRIYSNVMKLTRFIQSNLFRRRSLGEHVRERKEKYAKRQDEDLQKIIDDVHTYFGKTVKIVFYFS